MSTISYDFNRLNGGNGRSCHHLRKCYWQAYYLYYLYYLQAIKGARNEEKFTEMVDKMLDNKAKPKVFRAIEEGTVMFGEFGMNCAVLNDENETTVMTMRTLETALEMHRPRAKNKSNKQGLIVGGILPSFMRISAIKPWINNDLSLAEFKPLSFSLKKGGRAFGFPVSLLPNLINAWTQALNNGALSESQKKSAHILQAMGTAASAVGFIALIHEALGYQDRRKKTLLRIFAEIFEKEAHPWQQEFPLEFYEHIYRLRGKMADWKDLLRGTIPEAKPQTPSWIGKVTRDIIYSRLKPIGILEVLEKRNPTDSKGTRKVRHHQHLTKQQGQQILHRHIGSVLLLMKQNETWEEFYEALDANFPTQDGQYRFPFMDENRTSASDEVHAKLL